MQLTTSLHSKYRFTFASWLLLITATSSYCFLYDVIFQPDKINLLDSLSWSLKAWCVWLLLIPFIFKTIDDIQNEKKDFSMYLMPLLKLSVWLCSAALLIQLLLGWINGDELASSVYYYLPANLEIFIFISLFAIFVKKTNDHLKTKIKRPHLLPCISNNNQNVHLDKAQIDRLFACGNYIEIHSQNNVYMIRATMKSMEAELSADGFIRIHRSHIINKNNIAKVKTHANGQSFVITQCGTQLPLGRSYKQNINGQVTQAL